MDDGGGGDGNGDGDGDGEPGPDCADNLECPEGLCVEGMCCAFELVCGGGCCAEGEVCLFDACVVPGEACTTADDCDEDEYCELGLGEPSPGQGQPPPGLVCTQKLPPTGRCVGAPVVCTGEADDPPDCVEACEYMPTPGELNASLEWQWGHNAPLFIKTDVWATPMVARMYDANCDGELDANDPPNMVFVSGSANGTCCSCNNMNACRTGVLNLLDGRSGERIWANDSPEPDSSGWAGLSVALGDVDGDQRIDVVAMTGEGKIALVNANGEVTRISDLPVADISSNFGWGGAISIADMDHDGHPEIAFGRSLFSTKDGVIKREWVGTEGKGGGTGREISHMVDVDGDGVMDLLAGNTVYDINGDVIWKQEAVPDGFTAVADFDKGGSAEIVLVKGGLWVLDAKTGAIELGPIDIPFEDTRGGPPTIADFDGDGWPEIGIAGGNVYVVYDNDLSVLWQHPTQDTSSAVTGSSVFDFEGDGRAEVVYSDECFLRVFDGMTGELRFATPNTTFTATEMLVVADVDGDDSAEIVQVSNSGNWTCDQPPWTLGDPDTGLPPWEPVSDSQPYYRGISVYGAADSSWVGTRTIWNQHAYSVTNVCSSGDSACDEPNVYGAIPLLERVNWLLPWLNNFRQNVQDAGVYDAPNATVDLNVECSDPMRIWVSVRNIGLASLPAGVTVEVRRLDTQAVVGEVVTDQALFPGQIQGLELQTALGPDQTLEFVGEVVVDPSDPTFVECKDDDNLSEPASAFCAVP
ncbi:FG-GAP repeat domain-containing protein [Enhygromyxa salina]|nr:VCBS repeat-containing protein [Enhygromyxa salina]